MFITWCNINYYRLMNKSYEKVGLLFRIFQHINYYGFLWDNNDMPVTTIKDFSDILTLNERKTRKFIRLLYKKKILKKDEFGRIFVNPVYAMNNHIVYPECYKLFRKEMRPFLSEKDKFILDQNLRREYNGIKLD